ncbi:MAG TPA: hypothetical protein VN650_09545 [Gemmatimonadaceae bacterium]|nr:hypothetical protein [Gemmatimonadaceae bacterium]
MNANFFKPAMAAMVVAIAASGLVACSGTSEKSEPLSKVTQSPTTAASAEPATPAPPDSAATAPDTTATAPDTSASRTDARTNDSGAAKSAKPDSTPAAPASADAQPAISAHPMTAEEESTTMPMQGQANDHSTPETKPVPKN